jgi:hypothetical protein
MGPFDFSQDGDITFRPFSFLAWIFLLSFLGAPFWMYLMAIPSLVTYKVYFPPVELLPMVILSPLLFIDYMILWMLVADMIAAPWWVYIIAVFAARGSIINLVMWIVLLYLINAPWWMYLLGVLA